MSEKITSEVISRRRALSFLGLAALSLAVPPVVLTMSDAVAQQPTPPSTSTSTAEPGARRPEGSDAGSGAQAATSGVRSGAHIAGSGAQAATSGVRSDAHIARKGVRSGGRREIESYMNFGVSVQ